MNTIGETIVRLRRKQGLTQEALSALIGVSPQSVSKWENNANMPDISLLPLLADIFQCSLDELFGRGKAEKNCHPQQVLDRCCQSVLETIGGSMYSTDRGESFDEFMEYYRSRLRGSDTQRTAVIQGQGFVYYREKLGGFLLKKPQGGWQEYCGNEKGMEILQLLADKDFREVLTELCRNRITTFTLSFLCERCGNRDADGLEEKLHRSGLFLSRKIHVDDREIMVYECGSTARMSVLFAVLAAAAEYAEYEDCYTCYCGCGGEEFFGQGEF